MDALHHTPPAFAALAACPALHAAVADDLHRQATYLSACLAAYQPRSQLLATLAQALRDPHGGLVCVEAPPGSGASTLLAALAVRQPVALWFAGAAPTAAPALYAQLVALHRPRLPLLDPTATTDPAAFESLLAELAASRSGHEPIALLIDELTPPGEPLRPGPPPLPSELPPGITLLLSATPGAPLPYTPALQLRIPNDDPELTAAQHALLARLGCPAPWADRLVAASGGNFLYLRLGLAHLRAGEADHTALPAGLEGLLNSWWAGLTAPERRLAALLAAAGEPFPLALATELLGADPAPTLASWARLALIEYGPPGDRTVALTHRALAALIARAGATELGVAHADLATLASARADGVPGSQRAVTTNPAVRYLERQGARHAALAPRPVRDVVLTALTGPTPMRARQRRNDVAGALEAAAWELRVAVADGPPLRLVRAAALVGVLATRARSLGADMVGTALLGGLEQGSREATLRAVLGVVERMADGHAKAALLRHLGEICYGARMRSAAMRLLSRALDLEASPTSRAWRDTREGLLTVLAEHAIALGAVDTALAIAERIEHLERRAMIETQVVRQLLATGAHDRAQRVARGILHESMGAWARAEVAVELQRAGDPRGAMMLDELTLETVVAWAQIELACDDATHDEAAARRRIEALPTPGQRDRGLARLARVLATAGNDGAALAAAEAIGAVEVRVAALIDLRLGLEGLVAMLALERATNDIGALTGEDRAPLVSALAAALAALGRRDQALALAAGLPEGEERDRATARVAVALAQRGDHAQAHELIATLDDEDEQAWAYDEFASLLAAAGRWDEAAALLTRIEADDQRARTAADLVIARAQAGEAVPALAMALAIDSATERARALTLLAPALVTGGAEAEALAVGRHPEILTSAEQRGRYLASVAAALAEHGRTDVAGRLVAEIRRPADRARAGAALARALAQRSPELACAVLGATLRTAAVGREEIFRALELAAPALAALGGAELLGEVAATIVDADHW